MVEEVWSHPILPRVPCVQLFIPLFLVQCASNARIHGSSLWAISLDILGVMLLPPKVSAILTQGMST